jgi:hypothetical protein
MTLPPTPEPVTNKVIGYVLPNGKIVTYEFDADRVVPGGDIDWTTPEGRAEEQKQYDARVKHYGIQPGEATKLTWFIRTSLTTYSDYQPIGEDS